MKRYPHKARVVVNSGQVVDGQWQASADQEVEVFGRYDPSNNESLRVRNSLGNEVVAKAEFYTRQQPVAGANQLIIPELGVDETIICWWEFQTHTVIYV